MELWEKQKSKRKKKNEEMQKNKRKEGIKENIIISFSSLPFS